MSMHRSEHAQARLEASLAFLRAYAEGRRFEELRDELPRELEATGQGEGAWIIRSFFHLPKTPNSVKPRSGGRAV
jgi:hypothetical protein